MEPASGELRKLLRSMRKRKGLTQAQLAAMVGLERTSICNIELGHQQLTERTINDIARALGYRVRIKFELL